MDAEYALRYRELYERHWWWRAREALILETLERLQPRREGGAVLDVGCGDGLFFDRLAEYGEVEGVESDPSLVRPDGEHASRIHVGPFDEHFRPHKRYTLIVMLDVLEHMPDARGALAHAKRLLAPGGIIVATVPAFGLLWTAHDDMNQHVTRYTRRSFQRLADAAGVGITEAHYFFHWVFPAKLLVRLRERVVRPAPTPPAVPPSWINGALYHLSRLEQRVTGRLSLPFGSSLLVVARGAPE